MIGTYRSSAEPRDMDSVVNDVENLLSDVGSAGESKVQRLRERVGEAMDAARQQLGHLDAEVRGGAKQAVTMTNDYVHTSPWQAIGVGLAVGLAAGLLLTRRW